MSFKPKKKFHLPWSWSHAMLRGLNRLGLSLTRISNLPKSTPESLFMLLGRTGMSPTHILDIGANRAAWSKLASRFFPNVRYTLVEPQVELASFLEPFCASFSDSKWIQAGVGGREEIREFVVAPFADRSSSFNTPEELRTEEHEVRDIQVVTLDSIIQQRGIPEILKIDAEGSEMEILENSSTVLGQTELILVELAFFKFTEGPSFSEMIAFMAEREYEPYHFTWFNPRPHDGAPGQCELAFAKRNGYLRAYQGWE